MRQSKMRIPFVLLCATVQMMLFFTGGMVWAQPASEYEVVDPRFTFENNKIRITYALRVPLDHTYDIRITMRSVEDAVYSFVPKSVTGQVGQVKYLGGRLEVWWDYRQDNPTGFSGDFFFDINVTEVVEEGWLKWWHYAAAGAGVAAAAVLTFAKGSSPGSTPTPPASEGLPDPPRIQP
jgi:hypothetical protein